MSDLERVFDWAKCGIWHNYTEPDKELKILESVKNDLAAERRKVKELQAEVTHWKGGYNAANETIKELLTIIENSPLPEDCVAGFDEVKFCYFRNGEGNKCLRCLDKSVIDKAKNLLK
jgi:hypothetical protein